MRRYRYRNRNRHFPRLLDFAIPMKEEIFRALCIRTFLNSL